MNNEVTQWFNIVQAKREDDDLDPWIMVVEWNGNGLLQRGIPKNTIITRICDNYPTSVRQFLPTHSATPAIAPTLSESLFYADGPHVFQKCYNIVEDLQRQYLFRNVPSLGRVYLVSATRANVADILEIHKRSDERFEYVFSFD
ncbi:11624_t:CDS:2 [Entrophospora sp. SA101]|nr:11624_t:CDS:2 [Entrophospora sp. SA101]